MITKHSENRIIVSLARKAAAPHVMRVEEKSLKEIVSVYRGEPGAPGSNGVGIQNIDQLNLDSVRVQLTTGEEKVFLLPRGPKGDSVKGKPGLKGTPGKTGKDGRGIISITQPEPGIARVNYTDGTHDILKLPRGEDGREIELSASATHVRWRYVGQKTWKNLFEIPKGAIVSEGAGSLRVVTKINGLYGHVTISAGANITITQSGNNIIISGTGGGGGGGETFATMATSTVLTAANTNTVYDNMGAAALVVAMLPPAAQGLKFTFLVIDSDGFEINAAGTDTIRLGGGLTSAGGAITCVRLGGSVTLYGTALGWVASASQATWGLT